MKEKITVYEVPDCQEECGKCDKGQLQTYTFYDRNCSLENLHRIAMLRFTTSKRLWGLEINCLACRLSEECLYLSCVDYVDSP